MKILKNIIVGLALVMFAGFLGAPMLASAPAQAEEVNKFKTTISCKSEVRQTEVTLNYTSRGELLGEPTIVVSIEENEETLKKMEKFAKKKVDASSIGEVVYISTTSSNPEDERNLNGEYKITIKLPKFYHNKEIALIPFSDERTPQNLRNIAENEDGSFTFYGSTSIYAYAIVYNGMYRHIILIVIILLVLLVLCVTIKILCLRKDNPELKEKKKQKAIEQKKNEHKQNRKLAQELKREKEKLKKVKIKQAPHENDYEI